MPIIDMFWDEVLPDAIKGCDINNPQHIILIGLKKLHKQLVKIEDKLEKGVHIFHHDGGVEE